MTRTEKYQDLRDSLKLERLTDSQIDLLALHMAQISMEVRTMVNYKEYIKTLSKRFLIARNDLVEMLDEDE